MNAEDTRQQLERQTSNSSFNKQTEDHQLEDQKLDEDESEQKAVRFSSENTPVDASSATDDQELNQITYNEPMTKWKKLLVLFCYCCLFIVFFVLILFAVANS